MNLRLWLICNLISLIAALPAFGALQFTLSPSGSGVYLINGDGLENISGIQITLNYDPSSGISNPRVSKGELAGMAMLAVNSNQPGIVRIGLISGTPMNGTGTLARITFDQRGEGTGTITSFQLQAVDQHGVAVPSKTQVASASVPPAAQTPVPSPPPAGVTPAPSQPATPPAGGQPSTPSPQAETGKSGPAWLGGVTMPGEAREESERKPATPPPASPADQGKQGAPAIQKEPPSESPTKQPPPAEKKFTVCKSVLEKFREFFGEKTPANLAGLFEPTECREYRQEPKILLSDGTKSVKLYIPSRPGDENAPNFAIKGAKLIRLGTERGEWVLELMPDRGVISANVTIMLGNVMTEIPLVVAPRVTALLGNKELRFDDFRQFLADSDAKPPRFDLNGDGRHDYVDDYIFTANFIASGNGPVAGTPEKPKGK